ncbi:MAG: hypothetical protein KJI72_01905 [Patescibacteria group bacterium]|nr:hypothetical protein [Patescibacteria group bacterium]
MKLKLKKAVKRRILWFVLIVIAVLIIALYFFLDFNQPIQVPNEFLAARQNAAVVSKKIVALTGATNEKIKAVNLSDLSGNASQAHTLIQEARQNNAEAHNQAFELSGYLQELAESLSAISSAKSQRLAYEAVAVEITLVSEFIIYTQNLNNFLGSLLGAIQTNSFADRRAVQNYLDEVNERAEKINDLNEEFLVKIEKFDKSL